jgi:RNA polymerase sigma-70 factor (ECF subfamily)
MATLLPRLTMTMTLSRKTNGLPWSQPDAADFDRFFFDYWERVVIRLAYILGDWDEAEDLALETFIRLYRRPPKDGANLPAWLYRVATNLGLNALRARKRRSQYESLAGAQAIEDDHGQDAATVAESRLERERVRQVLSAMKPRSAELLILRYSGLSYAEVAAALGVAPASIGTLLARAEAEFEQLYERAVQDGEAGERRS